MEMKCCAAPLQAVLVGRTRDADDRCAWFLQVGRFADALALAEEELPAYGGAPPRRIVAQKTYDTVSVGLVLTNSRADLLNL